MHKINEIDKYVRVLTYMLLVIFSVFIISRVTMETYAQSKDITITDDKAGVADILDNTETDAQYNEEMLVAGVADVLDVIDVDPLLLRDEELIVKTAPTNNDIEAIYNFTEDERYELAKIAMAEAEGEDIVCKEMIIQTVLNRVESEDFPDTIHDVIYQQKDGVYQFTPLADGRYFDVEPNSECKLAVELVEVGGIISEEESLYFESCNGDSWHSENLELIRKFGNMRFYK